MRIAQISDTHFGTDVEQVVAALKNSLREAKPDFLLLSGDITQRARKSQFIKAQRFLEELELPYRTIPGNHDIPLFDVVTRFTKPYRLYTEFFGAREFTHIHNGIAVIGLDATGPSRHKQGQLDLDHVSTLLTTARQKIGQDALLIVSVHQPLLTAWPEDRSEEMIDEEHVAKLFSSFHVDAVLSGHVHVPLICTSDKAYPELPYPFIHIGAGTATSHRTREGKPNSFNMIDLNNSQKYIQVRQYDYQSEEKLFGLVTAQTFGKNAAGNWQAI